jgi:hypothetical protein
VFEGLKESLLQAGVDEPVCFLDLAVGLGMCYRCVLDLDSELFGEFLKLARGEVTAVIGDDAVGHSISVEDGLEELYCRSRFLVGDRDCFDPLGELVNGD